MTTKNKPNGSYSTKHGPNGGAVPAGEPSSARARRLSTRASHEQGRAGSVDASVFSGAGTAPQAAGPDRKATADLAEPAAGKQLPGTGIASMPALAAPARIAPATVGAQHAAPQLGNTVTAPPHSSVVCANPCPERSRRNAAPQLGNNSAVVGRRFSATHVDAEKPNADSEPSQANSSPKPARSAKKSANPFAKVPPGREPLPEDGEAFVDAVHAQVDLVALEVALLRCQDEKVVQRELGSLRELRYGKRAPLNEGDDTEIIFDAPRPERPTT
jgi:hypothetical protein